MYPKYTTLRGNIVDLNPALWRAIRRMARNRFDGSQRLFDSCWKQYRAHLRGSINDPENLNDVTDWLDAIASEKVNSGRSSFYIYG